MTLYSGRLGILAIWVLMVSFSSALAMAQESPRSATTAATESLPRDVYPESRFRLPLVKRDELTDEEGKIAERQRDARGPGRIRAYDPVLADITTKESEHLRTKNGFGDRLTELAVLQAWYARTFGAKPGMRLQFQAADIPGVNLSWAKSDTTMAPTKGRALDHIGFEVKNLEAFCKKLEAGGMKLDRPYSKTPAGVGIAFITDPWGTQIELNEH